MICARCGTENRPGRLFCRSCGSGLAAPCPTCGAQNEPGDRFCGTCGSALPGAQDQSTRLASNTNGSASGATADGRGDVTTERRLVSVMFVDLVGFTALAADRDAEAVRELLGRYFDHARDVVGRYGGTVEKFIGDAVMAVWGTPTAHEDDAERAVRAAIELVGSVPGIDTRGAGTLTARAAVLTGQAAVAVGAQGQGMVAGDLVNTASRLQSVAPPGGVLVGEATVRASESSIVYEPAGEQSLRGKESPVPAWLAVRVVAGRHGSGRSSRLEAPFVGRDDELRILKELFHATARERRPRLVSITGIAGIGKSRLAWELEKYLDGLAEPVYWHQGRSPAYGEGLAFWALGEMVRGRAGIAESDDPPTARTKLHAAAGAYLVDSEEADWIERRLAVLLGLEPSPSGSGGSGGSAGAGGSGEELFAAWRTLFERIAERGPTVLVFEELHWADATLLTFVEDLVARARNRPILVVTLARPELLERRPSWGAGQRSFTSLDLDPLEPGEMDELLSGLVPGLPSHAVRAIRDRAEGVPLYAVETVRMLLDQGSVVEVDGRYQVAGPVGPLAIPDTLSGLVGARLDALPEDERSLIGHASILGQSFTVTALGVLSGQDDADVAATLERLERRELLALDTDPRSPERGQYRFVQGLLRDVAHGRVSRRERLARHLAAARFYESQEDDELAGIVASHYLEAYEAAADEAEKADLRGRASRALVAAGERALSLSANAGAIGHFESAAEIAADPVDRRRLLERAADAAVEGRQPADAEAYARRVLEIVRSEPVVDRDALARACSRLGRTLVYAGHPGDAVRVLADAIDEVGDVESDSAGVALGVELARALLMSGRSTESLAVIDRFAQPVEDVGDRELIAELLVSEGWAIGAAGRYQEGIALLRGGLVLAERDARPSTRFRAAMNLTAQLLADNPRETLAIALEHHAAARRLGFEGWAQSLAGNASDPALWTGEWDLVEALAREAAEDELEGLFRFQVDLTLAVVRALRGRIDQADEIVARVAAHQAGTDDPQMQLAVAWVTMALDVLVRDVTPRLMPSDLSAAFPLASVDAAVFGTRAALWSGERSRLGEFEELLGRQTHNGRWAGAVRMGALATMDVFAGRLDRAVARYDEAAAVLRRLDVPVDLALVLIDRVIALPDAPGCAEAEVEARAILDRLGASGLLRRFEGLVERPPSPEAAGVPASAGVRDTA